MGQVQYQVAFAEARNRLTTAFRVILAIPHAVFASVWGEAAQLAAVIQWFKIVFTGQRLRGIYDFQQQWLGYASRVYSYETLLFDEYPKFGTDPSGVPMATSHSFEDPANRLTSGLRLIWMIPAVLIMIGLVIATFFVLIGQWFTILFTGKANRGMWDFTRKTVHFGLQTSAYGLLMTDTYPKYGA